MLLIPNPVFMADMLLLFCPNDPELAPENAKDELFTELKPLEPKAPALLEDDTGFWEALMLFKFEFINVDVRSLT